MKNKFLKIFLVLIVLFSFTGCGKDKEKDKTKEPEEVKENNNNALIWEVKSDTATVYLAGSIHVADEDAYPLQQVLLDAFADSEILAVEADVTKELDEETLTALMPLMTYTDGRTARDYLSDETETMLDDYIENYGIAGMGSEQAAQIYIFHPWTIQNLIDTDIISESDLKAELGIDVYFLNEAKKRNIEIVEVESILFQYNMFSSFSPELQELLLKTTLETERGETIVELEELLDIWKQGDVDLLTAKLMEESTELTAEELKLYEEYNKAMYTDRNVVMADKVEELLKGDKNVFYMVGSAHYVGEDGIIQLLTDRGYTVTKK